MCVPAMTTNDVGTLIPTVGAANYGSLAKGWATIANEAAERRFKEDQLLHEGEAGGEEHQESLAPSEWRVMAQRRLGQRG